MIVWYDYQSNLGILDLSASSVHQKTSTASLGFVELFRVRREKMLVLNLFYRLFYSLHVSSIWVSSRHLLAKGQAYLQPACFFVYSDSIGVFQSISSREGCTLIFERKEVKHNQKAVEYIFSLFRSWCKEKWANRKCFWHVLNGKWAFPRLSG